MNISSDYQPLTGSGRTQPDNAKSMQAADLAEQVTIRVILRRRIDVPAQAGIEAYLAAGPAERAALSAEEHARRFGAAASDLDRVQSFLRSGGLTISEAHAASRTVVAVGTAAQMSELFSVPLRRYEMSLPSAENSQDGPPRIQAYRSYEGPVHVPGDLAEIIVAVLGLDNRRITGRNSPGEPPGTGMTTVPQIMHHYNFPASNAAGQTIGIFAAVNGADPYGYNAGDIKTYFSNLAGMGFSGFTVPRLVNVENIDGTTNDPGNPAQEVTADICVASTVAQGATIAVYFNQGDENGWQKVLQRAAFPQAGDPAPSVLSSSFVFSSGDDPEGAGYSPMSFDALTMAFQDAGAQGVTVCVASGDLGAGNGVNDSHRQHVQYPASDPWVLACGGTTVGGGSGGLIEWVWNVANAGATGGGVSFHFGPPAYQAAGHVPVSKLDGHAGRGVPDVAGNANPNSGYYPLYCAGSEFTAWGTSMVAPLYAGLFAVINAALGKRVGFINPTLYALGSSVCRDVDPAVAGGPADNGYNGVTGYPAGAGWDACTGLGHIDGSALLSALKAPAWSRWFWLGGNCVGVAAVTLSAVETDIYVIGADNELWQKWWDGSAWHPSDSELTPHGDGQKLRPGSLSVIAHGPGFRDVYAIDDQTGQLIHKYWDGAKWTQWFWLGGNCVGVAAVTLSAVETDIYVIGADHELWQKWWDGSAWHPSDSELTPHGDGQKLRPGSLSVIARGPGQRDVFAIDPPTGQLIYKSWDGTVWSPWRYLGGNCVGVAATELGPVMADFYVIGTDHELWQKWWDGSHWQPGDTELTHHLDGQKLRPGSLAVIAHGPGFRDVYAIDDQTGQLIHKYWS